MVKVSNAAVGILNFLTLLISFPVIGVGLWFRIQVANECERFLYLPLLILGAFLFVVSVLGLVGSSCRVSVFLWIYLLLVFLLIVALVTVTVVVFVLMNKGMGQALSGKGYSKYGPGDYSHWLQKRVRAWNNWRVIEDCLKEAKICGRFVHGLVGVKASGFYKQNLSPIQSGCCKPPMYCRFTYVNATYWTAPTSGAVSSELDCMEWSNDQEKLCHSCNSCKVGVLATLKDGWRKIAIFNVALLMSFIIIYSVGCCALRNNKARNHYYMGGYH